MSGVRIAAAGALALAASACIGPGDFRCTEHAQCTLGGQPGFCEVNGHCSAGDNRCLPSHRRYVHQAGDDADACVPASCGEHAITAFSAGGGHACLLRDRSLWCWGRNDHGQLGDGTRTPRALPVRVSGVSDVVAVAAGDGHTCAAQDRGPVFCWGADDAGQLGDGGITDHVLPQEVAGVTGATALAAGKDFSCAFSDGTVHCWGDDSVGQLGDGGGAGPPRPPVAIAGITGVTALSASWRHACAVHGTGELTCWGANDQGQIGDNTQTAAHAPTTLTALPPMPPLPRLPSTIRKVVTGHDHTCALADDGLRCWGGNGQGQVDPGGSSGAIPTPKEIIDASLADPLDVAAGAQHTCIVRTGSGGEHPVSCWGANGSDQRDADPPVADATKVVAGATFSCAIASDGALFCWGDNHFGQLAIGGDTIRPTPAQVPGLAHASALAAGGAHNCATADDAGGARTLFCWGANGSGQLGNGSSIDATEAIRISSLQPGAIAAGAAHTCAFPADKELRCWGSGTSGQLGQSPGVDGVITIPTVTDLGGAQGGDGVFAVAAGASHTCVGATISLSVLCFGLNTDGQLGGPSGQSPWTLVPSFLGKPQALAAGEAHSCALDGDGAIWCWGRGDEGQLGDKMGVDHLSPTAVALGDGVAATAIAAGARHTCALAGGKILCWGRNGEGQLGAPLPAPLLEPTEVSGLSQPRAIAAGERHTCAIDDDTTVSCWGANESGQLGNGKTEPSNSPVPVDGLTNVDAIVTGRAHSCARRTDGTVWCWGANTSGQLGDGVTLTSARPLLARIGCE